MGGHILELVRLCRFGGFEESLCRFYFKQMLSVLHYMHYRGIAHCDLKLDNVLLDE